MQPRSILIPLFIGPVAALCLTPSAAAWQRENGINVELAESGVASPTSGPTPAASPASAPPAAPAATTVVGSPAAPMRPAPPARAEASATERFVRQLAAITSRYFMEVAYRTAPSDDFSDAFWAGARARAVAELLNSPLGGEIPAPLNQLCREALLLDGMLQIIYAKGDGEADRNRDEVLGIIEGTVRGLPGTLTHGSRESDSVEGRGLEAIINILDRVQQTEQMYRIFREAKAKADLHRRWADLLTDLAAAAPGLRPFAADPRTTDPSWHFLHRGLGGDRYFGATRDPSRTAAKFSVNASTHDIGDLNEGPIRIHFSSRSRDFGYLLKMRGTEYGAVYVGRCRRGQFSLVNSNGPSAWVTSTMTDAKNKGRLAFLGRSPGRRTNLEVFVWHFATIGLMDDTETEGEVLLYLEHQFPSEAAAAKAARRVEL